MRNRNKIVLTSGPVLIGVLALFYIGVYFGTPIGYEVFSQNDKAGALVVKGTQEGSEPEFIVTHIATPEPVKAIYMTSCVAATPSIRARLVKLAEETEINSIVIDIKDYSGTVSFIPDDSNFAGNDAGGCIASGMKEFIGALHDKNIYVIGRITVFQDSFYSKLHPELAIKKASDQSVVWKDYKGLSFIDVGAKEYWKYISAISKESYAIGFDELNYDYIRYPSDGNMNDIYYPFSEEQVVADPEKGKADILKRFFAYLDEDIRNTGIPTSADLFGMTTTNGDDLNIGQILEYAEPHFDYIAPMVYPSHYPTGFNGHTDVNAYPYEIVKFSMDEGIEKLLTASSTASKLRPWLQDFDYPVPYTPDMVQAQIQATYDAGLTSWMMWDPANVYTKEVYTLE